MNSAERRWKRFKVDIRVRLWRWEEAEESASVVRSYELSEGGMSVYVPDATLAVGTHVLLAFSLPPNEKPVRIRAVVMNRRGFRYGLQFAEVPAADRLEVLRYLGSAAGVV